MGTAALAWHVQGRDVTGPPPQSPLPRGRRRQGRAGGNEKDGPELPTGKEQYGRRLTPALGPNSHNPTARPERPTRQEIPRHAEDAGGIHPASRLRDREPAGQRDGGAGDTPCGASTPVGVGRTGQKEPGSVESSKLEAGRQTRSPNFGNTGEEARTTAQSDEPRGLPATRHRQPGRKGDYTRTGEPHRTSKQEPNHTQLTHTKLTKQGKSRENR